MKQINLTVSFDDEKLTALRRYMAKKSVSPEQELTDALAKLYEKYIEPKTKIKAIPLPSTSPANAAWTLDRLIEAWECINSFL